MSKFKLIAIIIILVTGVVTVTIVQRSASEVDNYATSNSRSSSAARVQVGANSGPYVELMGEGLPEISTDKAVLFFHAIWCPTCAQLHSDIMREYNLIPNNTTVIKVDFDKYTDLRRKYGVNFQHTLVQIDPETGELLTKWSGSNTLNELISELI